MVVFAKYEDIHGVLLLDKPKGISSNDALQRVKRIYKVKRAGHTGSLDPLATGMLPLCFGKATKFSQYSLNSKKRYRVIAKLGQQTDTLDADGKITQERPVFLKDKQLDAALESLRGKILQIPPMYSAVKYKGKKLYEYIRRGVEVPRVPRLVTIYELLLIRYDKKNELELEIYCSKGTYIRTIIDDLGKKLGCGAHVSDLRRLSVGNYPIERMITLRCLHNIVEKAKETRTTEFSLLRSLLMPIDSLVSDYPVVNLPVRLSFYFKHGHSIVMKNLSLREGLVRVTEGIEKTFLGIGEFNNKKHILPRRLVD